MASDAYLSVSPAWVFRRAADIKTIFLDTTNFIKKGNTNFAQMIGEDWDVIPTALDPPRHTSVRRVLNPMFTPAKVGEFEHKVREPLGRASWRERVGQYVSISVDCVEY